MVMDGRDIGTCVLPEADVKVYLTASSLVRARRRYRELTEKGVACDLKEIEQDILDRDHREYRTGSIRLWCRRRTLFIWIPPI